MNKLTFNNPDALTTFNSDNLSNIPLPSSFPAVLMYIEENKWTYRGSLIGSYEWVELKDFIVPIIVNESRYE